jgi:hypothetical protein
MSVQSTYNTNPPKAFEGLIFDADGNEDTVPGLQGEATAAVAFGRVVKFHNPGGDQAFRLPTAVTDVIKGILTHSHAIDKSDRGELLAGGVTPGAVVNILREGRVWAVCENGCVPGDRLHVRVAAGTQGACRSAADGANTIDATAQGQWETTALAGELAVLAVNFKTK